MNSMNIQAQILDAMPATRRQIVVATRRTSGTIKHHLRAMRDAGQCHIGGWGIGVGGGVLPAIYHRGPGTDAPYPADRVKDAKAVIRARWLAKARASGHWDKVRAQRRIREQQRKQAKKAADRLWAAPLFTEPRPYY
jgi:hypothetical protein